MWHLVTNNTVDDFKVYDGASDGLQDGKHMVIYTDISDYRTNNNLEFWSTLLNEIERDLINNKIAAGLIPKFRFEEEESDIKEPQIAGSQYLYVRRSVGTQRAWWGGKKSEKGHILKMSIADRRGLFGNIMINTIYKGHHTKIKYTSP